MKVQELTNNAFGEGWTEEDRKNQEFLPPSVRGAGPGTKLVL